MKNFKIFSLFAFIGLLLFSCSKEEIDQLALSDFPPGILSISPADGAKVVKGDFNIVITFADGTVSPLQSASATLLDPNGGEITSASTTLGGTLDSLKILGTDFGAADLDLGIYSLDISVTDNKNQTANKTTTFEISNLPFAANYEKMYMAGSYNGWGADEFELVGPNTWQLTEAMLDGGEWKLKNCADWCDKDWGDPDCDGFLEETTGGGPNSACSPSGQYNVILNDQTLLVSFVSSVTFDQNITDLYLLGTFNNFQGEDYHFSQVDDNLWKLNEVELSTGDQFRFAEGPVFMGKNFGDNEGDGIAEEFGLNIEFTEATAFYNVTFNDKTLEYGYEFVRFPSIGIIGDATPGGWDTDTDMTDKGDGTFEIFIELTDGFVKFRANDSWDLSWGGTDFPEGIAVVNTNDNIPVVAGSYTVTFNPTTLEYKFVSGDLNIGIIGTATPGGWDFDTDLYAREDGKYCIVMELLDGEAKFRLDDAWDVAWGGSDFPSGIADPDGGAPNIPVTAGIYSITFDPGTLEYNFGPGPQSIGILGDATPGGWDVDQDLSPNGDGTYSTMITLTDGEVKFRADDAWDVAWGGPDFPTGVASQDGGAPNIPVIAGTYTVTFNPCTGEYNFGPAFTNIGLIGTATSGGWDFDIDLTDDDGDGTFEALIGLIDGEAKFRADDAWDAAWGGTDFPSGTGDMDGGAPNIMVTAGVYIVSFNPSTAAYNFEAATIGVIGSATPGGWDSDTDLTVTGVVPGDLTVMMDFVDGEAKFRLNDSWDIAAWGATDFPSGTAVPDPGAPNIPVTAGTYTLRFNVNTLEYSFE